MWTTSRSVRSARQTRFGVSAVAAAWVIWATPARAEEGVPIELSWDGPPNCGSSAEVLAKLRQLAGKKNLGGSPLDAEASVARGASGQLRLRLVIHREHIVGTRDFEGDSCDDLVGAVAVSLAVLLDSQEPLEEPAAEGRATPEREHGSSGKTSEALPAADSKPKAATPAPSVPAPSGSVETTAQRRWRLLLVAPSGVVQFGLEPKPGFGLAVAAGAALDRWRFYAEGKLWAAQTATTTRLLDRYGAKLERFSLGVRACRGWGGPVLELGPCALVSLQHLSIRGEGPRITPRNSSASWIAAGVGVQLRARVSPWLSLVAGVDGELELSRPQVILDGIGLVEQLGTVAATAMVGSEWAL